MTSIGNFAFFGCTTLSSVYFQGNAPELLDRVFHWYDEEGNERIDPATVYYLPGTTGWEATYADRPTAPWLPEMKTTHPSFGVQTNRFGFTVTWASDKVVVVEAADDLTKATWTPVSTNTLAGGTAYFSDPEWAKYPSRFYRIRTQ